MNNQELDQLRIKNEERMAKLEVKYGEDMAKIQPAGQILREEWGMHDARDR